MNLFRGFFALCVAIISLDDVASKEPVPYDLVLRGGQIVDGMGNPWYYGDVAIRGDRIVAVGRIPQATAKREIDAKGLVIAPGFIDIHSHSDFLLLEDGAAQSKIRQGVTTEILGEGQSAGPYQGKLTCPPTTVKGKSRRWTTLGEYFDLLEESTISVNVGSYVGLDNIWQSVMGTSFDRPTPAQMEQMKTLVDESMKQGALGLSSLLAQAPGLLTTTDDVVALCKVTARHGGIFSSHIRNEGTDVLIAVKEAITIGEKAQIPVDIIHLKIAEQKLWGKMDQIVILVTEARQRGINIQANVYPYTRGNNDLASIIPPWAHEGGTEKMLARLQNGKDRTRLKREIREGLPNWYNHYTAVGGDWSRMLVSGKGSYEGLTMERIIAAKKKGKDPAPDDLDILFEVLVESNGSVPTVYEHHTEADMNLALKQPWCSIGSDGAAYATDGPLRRGNPHPRNFGTFPRVLGVYVRQTKLLTLEDAIRKMTSLNAAKVGIEERGIIRAGNYADITLFDAKTIIDRSTYTQPFLDNEGVKYVIVNGKIVLEKGRHTGEHPGKALRHRS